MIYHKQVLTSLQTLDCEVLLLIRRMCRDWDKLAPNMRKAWNFKDTSGLHAACGGFIYFMNLLKEKLPTAEFEKVHQELEVQFKMGFWDPDIHHALETTAPPAPVDSVQFLRSGVLTRIFATTSITCFCDRKPCSTAWLIRRKGIGLRSLQECVE